MTWRGWAGFAGLGCAGALAYRGDWRAACGAAACVLLLTAWWVHGEFAATRARMRESAELGAALADAQAARAGMRG